MHDTLSILLIEDDPGDAELFREQLFGQRNDAEVVVTPRLSNGLDMIRRIRPDMVFLDVNLPDSRGLSSISSILKAAPEIPIVVLTGIADDELGMDAVKLGAQDYLVKGEVDGRLLVRAARYAIERKKLELALKRANEKLARLATTDPLTGICNRLKLDSELDVEMERSRRYQVPLCLIIFDIDHFKQVNDIHGHQAGDRVLRMTTDLVSANIRSTDWFGRWGGEEFMILATHMDIEEAVGFAEKLRGLIARYDFGKGLSVTASFGITKLRDEDSAENFTARADRALYRAKENGRNRVESDVPDSLQTGMTF